MFENRLNSQICLNILNCLCCRRLQALWEKMFLRVAGHDLFNYFAVQYHHFIRSVVSSTAGFQGFRCGRHSFFFQFNFSHKLFSGTLPHSNHRLFAQIEVGKIENKNNTPLDAHGTTKNTFKVRYGFSFRHYLRFSMRT